MKYRISIIPAILLLLLTAFTWPSIQWVIKSGKKYDLHYTNADKNSIKEYQKLIDSSIHFVTIFFDTAYRSKFDVFIHPDRNSLDSNWQTDWNMPQYKSECKMVAIGVASRFDIIAPKTWDKQSCEHKYADKRKMQQLVIQEMVHVFHEQINASPDFGSTENIEWFVKGLAGYASGQLDSISLVKVKEQIIDRTWPKTLNNFWSGDPNNGLAASIVMYIDNNYGRAKLRSLLSFTKKSEILEALETNEDDLLKGWSKFINS